MNNYNFIKTLTFSQMVDYFEKIGTCKFCSKGNSFKKCDGNCREGIREWLAKKN